MFVLSSRLCLRFTDSPRRQTLNPALDTRRLLGRELTAKCVSPFALSARQSVAEFGFARRFFAMIIVLAFATSLHAPSDWNASNFVISLSDVLASTQDSDNDSDSGAPGRHSAHAAGCTCSVALPQSSDEFATISTDAAVRYTGLRASELVFAEQPQLLRPPKSFRL